MRARRTGGVSAQPRHAAWALATAASTSAAPASASSRSGAPLAGLSTVRRAPLPLSGAPPTQCGTSSGAAERGAATVPCAGKEAAMECSLA